MLTDLCQYYADLLAYEYRGRPNATAQVKLFAKQALADLLVDQIVSAFDVDTAVGKQLDIIGKYVGVPRNIGSVIPKPYFGFWSYASTLDITKYQGTWNPVTNTPTLPTAAGGNNGYWYVVSATGDSTVPIVASFIAGDIVYSDGTTWKKETTDNGNGFTTYNDYSANANGVFYSYDYSQGQNSDLTDAQYRTVIKLKILLNSNDATLKTITDYLWLFWGPAITVVDNTNMTMDYFVYNTVPLSKELLAVYLPRPMGVRITITIVVPPATAGGPLTTEDGRELTTEQGAGFDITTENP